VVHQPGGWLALCNRHVERVQDELGAQVVSHRPAHDPPRERVEDHREIQPPFAGALLGDVSDPEPVGPGRGEVPLDQVRSW
jgi:hypothetical protein